MIASMNTWIMTLLLVLFGGCLVAGHSSIEFRTIPLTDDDASTNVIELTDLNFDAMVNGSSDWMINLHSEWCPACQEMKPVWSRLGLKSQGHGYRVGKVDVTAEKVLLYRFQVTKLPTVMFISKDYGTMYEYQGARTVNTMHHFAIKGWRRATPLSGCSSPVSRCGRLMGALLTGPKRIQNAFVSTRKDFKYGDVTLIALIVGVPVCIGICSIFLVDVWVTKRKLH